MPPDVMPILGTMGQATAPWSLLEPHADRAYLNHGQTLERLRDRGGLDICEVLAILEDRVVTTHDVTAQHARLTALIREHTEHPPTDAA